MSFLYKRLILFPLCVFAGFGDRNFVLVKIRKDHVQWKKL